MEDTGYSLNSSQDFRYALARQTSVAEFATEDISKAFVPRRSSLFSACHGLQGQRTYDVRSENMVADTTKDIVVSY